MTNQSIKRSDNNQHYGFEVVKSGMLALLQDKGRFGKHNIGLTTSGPIDKQAFLSANYLCGNQDNDTVIELTVGGLELKAKVNTEIAITGAKLPVTVNGKEQPQWQTLQVNSGDIISFGFVTAGMRVYIAVKGGFSVEQSFGSTATVTRESIGGLNGNKLAVKDFIHCENIDNSLLNNTLSLDETTYSNEIVLRVVLGYQHNDFTQVQKQMFFSSEYTVSESCDRMGYRLDGPSTVPSITGILSEGICLGAIQVPANGLPIILMNDRQTIGGYPKIGSVLSIDLAKLGQCGQGAKVRFELISIEQAHNLVTLENGKLERVKQSIKPL